MRYGAKKLGGWPVQRSRLTYRECVTGKHGSRQQDQDTGAGTRGETFTLQEFKQVKVRTIAPERQKNRAES